MHHHESPLRAVTSLPFLFGDNIGTLSQWPTFKMLVITLYSVGKKKFEVYFMVL